MKKVKVYGMLILAATFLFTACSGVVPSEPTRVVEQLPIMEPTPVVEQSQVIESAPVIEQPPQVMELTINIEPSQLAEVVAFVSTEPQNSTSCEAGSAGCEASTIEMLDKSYCVNKWPYAIMSVPAGSTYEPLDERLNCQDQLNNDGSLRITCNDTEGRELWTYDLKVCNTAGGDGCVVYQVDIGACPLPNKN